MKRQYLILLFVFILYSSFTYAALNDSKIIDYWKIDNSTSGTTVFYSNLSSRTFTILNGDGNNAGQATAINGYSVFLDNDGASTATEDDDIIYSDNTIWRPLFSSGEVTVSFWYYMNSENSVGGGQNLFRFGGSTASPTYKWGCVAGAGGSYDIRWMASPNMFAVGGSNKGCSLDNVSYGPALSPPTGKWSHLVYSWRYLNSTHINHALYLNSSLYLNSTIRYQGPYDFSYITFGHPQWGWAPMGYIDEIGIWNRSLSTAEITELYNSGVGNFYPFAPAVVPLANITSGYVNGVNITSGNNVIPNFTVTNMQYPISGLNYTFNYSNMEFMRNLTLWYQFNNNSAVGDSPTLANDVNNRINGTILGGPLYNDNGKFGKALNIITTDDKINTSVKVINSSKFTIAFWNKINGQDSNAGYWAVDAGATTNFFCRYYNPSGTNYLTCTINGTSMGNLGDNNINSYGTWHLTTLVRNGTHNKMYQDGVLLGTTASNFPGISTYLIIGNNLASTRYFNGSIDDYMIWNDRELTLAEILYLNKSKEFNKLNHTAFFVGSNEGALPVGNYNYSLNITDAQGMVNATRTLNVIAAAATCVTPTYGLNLTENTTYNFCNGTYDFRKNVGNIDFRANQTHNVTILCNNTVFIGNNSANYSYGMYVQGKNISISGCTWINYSVGIYLHSYLGGTNRWTTNTWIENNTFIGMGGFASIFTDGVTNFTMKNNTFYNNTNLGQTDGGIGCHAIYISGDVGNSIVGGDIYNNYIQNTSASGIKLNGQDTIQNIKIYNNKIVRLEDRPMDDIGVMLADTRNISVYNNTFVGPYDSGIVLAVGANSSKLATDIKIYNNNFSSVTSGIWFRYNNTQNHTIYNNTYTGGNLWWRISNYASFRYINESFLRTGTGWAQYKANFSNFVAYNVTIHLG